MSAASWYLLYRKAAFYSCGSAGDADEFAGALDELLFFAIK
jgi:hypothetical protein